MNRSGSWNAWLFSTTFAFAISACQTLEPKDGGTMGKMQQALKPTVEQSKAKPATPPPEVSAALLPPIDFGLGSSGAKKTEARFDVSVSDIPAKDFLMGLVEGTSFNMVVHPAVQGTISLSLKNVTIPEVMGVLRDVYSYEYQQTRSGFHVLPSRLQSQIFQVSYLNVKRSGSSQTRVSSGQISESSGSSEGGQANRSQSSSGVTSGSEIQTLSEADFWSELASALQAIVGAGEGRAVVVTPQSGIVVVRAMPSELREVAAYLSSTDNALHRQVILEAKILEVELSDTYQAGINWGGLLKKGNNTLGMGQAGGGNPFSENLALVGIDTTQAGITEPGGTPPIDFTDFDAFGGFFGAVLSTGDFTAFIELLQTQGNVQVLSSPRVSTLNNQKAVIKVGTDEFFVTDVSSTTVTGTATTTTPDITLTPFFSGIALDVTPQINQQGGVTLHIHPAVSNVVNDQKQIEVGNQQQSLPLAKSTVRESDSIVFANSGQLIVIGGMMKEVTGEDVASTPVLGDLPGIGSLFRYTQQGKKMSELVILVRPTVIDSASGWRQPIGQTADSLQQLDRGFHYGSRPGLFGNRAEPTWGN